jgi:hypothetical protein
MRLNTRHRLVRPWLQPTGAMLLFSVSLLVSGVIARFYLRIGYSIGVVCFVCVSVCVWQDQDQQDRAASVKAKVLAYLVMISAVIVAFLFVFPRLDFRNR